MEAILASVVAPAVIDLLKGLFTSASRRILGLSVDDQAKLQSLEIEKLKVLGMLDSPNGTPRQWVVDLRASFRYVMAGVLIVVGCGIMIVGLLAKDATIVAAGGELAGMPFGFIYGERLYLGLKGAPK